MKRISEHELARLLREGLSEEVQLEGRINAYSENTVASSYFSYQGKFTLKSYDKGSISVGCPGGANLTFTPRKEKIEYHDSYLFIPTTITPESSVKIECLENIVY